MGIIDSMFGAGPKGMRKPSGIRHNGKTVAEILEAHLNFFAGKPGGVRGDLSGADLRNIDLQGANLAGANLKGAKLVRANFSGAKLRGTDLRATDMTEAHLPGADLTEAQA